VHKYRLIAIEYVKRILMVIMYMHTLTYGAFVMKQKLKIGDILYRSKNLVEHAGAYLDDNRVIHNTPDGDVEICTVEQFADGKNIKVVTSGLTALQTQQFQERAKSKLDQSNRYNVFSFNCEQLVSEIINGEASSPQVKGAVMGTLAAMLLAKASNSKHPLWFAFAGGLLGCTMVNAKREYDFIVTT